MIFDKMMIPVGSLVSVTPSDTDPIRTTSEATKAVWVGQAGDLRVLTACGEDIVIKNVPVGLWPFSVRQIFATNTGAQEILACFFK